jgi:hypothetical protein
MTKRREQVIEDIQNSVEKDRVLVGGWTRMKKDGLTYWKCQ